MALAGRGTGWAALLAVLVVVLAAAATVVDKWASLRWLWLVLILAGVLAGAPAALLASPWWQDRQATRRAQAAEAATRAQERTRDRRDHFDPRGRGVLPFGGRQGWYFTGRVRALGELAGWLATAPDGRPVVRVVTGVPGSGKSALLGRLVLLADPDRRRAALQADPELDPGTVPPAGSIDLSVHARGRTPTEVLQALAGAVGIHAAGEEDLLHALRTRNEPVTVVVDAVDEASGDEELPGVLARLAETGGVRLLVGVRRHLVDRLVAPQQALDLDDPAYLGSEDLVEYVRRCLLLEGDPQAPTPYRGRPELAGRVARAVAAHAQGSFLVAQLVSLALVNSGLAAEVAELGGAEGFPREVATAMRAYLDGFGAERSRVRDLLMPLAFAEGDGLADEAVWAVLASELGTAPYHPHDVRWLLADTSAPNLLQPTRTLDGPSAWRLFHAALAEYLRDHETRLPSQEVQRRVTQVLVSQVPRRADKPDWLVADAYARTHLATHAAEAGHLNDLIKDPVFLVAADPVRLLQILSRAPLNAQPVARLYRRTAHHLTAADPPTRAAVLRDAALRSEPALAPALAFPFEPAWNTLWTDTRTVFHQTLTGHRMPYSLAVARPPHGRALIASGGEDAIRIWDATTGLPLKEFPRHADGPVTALALTAASGRVLLASAGYDDAVRVWDVDGDKQVAELRGHTEYPTGLVWIPGGTACRNSSARAWTGPFAAGTLTSRQHDMCAPPTMRGYSLSPPWPRHRADSCWSAQAVPPR